MSLDNLQEKLIKLNGEYVLLDRDVAKLYGVETRVINQSVKNNPEKFPAPYIISLKDNELRSLRSKFLISNNGVVSNTRGGNRYAPTAFTEKGLYMLATILKSPAATQATIEIIETFAKVRSLKRDIVALHEEKDAATQKATMQRFSDNLAEIVAPDLQTTETESTLELNFVVGKLKHTIRRTSKSKE